MKNRPKRMTELVAIRFTPRELQEVREVADGYGCSVSEVLRRSFREAVWRRQYSINEDNSDGVRQDYSVAVAG